MAPTFNAIGLTVADMAASLAFYRKLGLNIPADADSAPHADVTLDGGTRLMFDTYDTIRSFDPEWKPASGGGPQVGLAFECADPAEVDAVYAEMTKAGYDGHHEPWDAVWGQRYAALRDPDGNSVDLHAPLPTP
jgi:catechol 2,3-dioxygenase-like lactoylglutathione lyase family enzyme